MMDKAVDFMDGAGRQHVSDAAWELWRAEWPGVTRDYLASALVPGTMLVTVEEWESLRWMEAAAKDGEKHLCRVVEAQEEEIKRLRAELARVPNSGTNAPKSRTGALLLTREADARLGFGDAGEER